MQPQRPLTSPLRSVFKPQSQGFNVLASDAFYSQSHPSGFFSTTVAPVDLSYDALHPKDAPKAEKPLIILHGLLCVLFFDACVSTFTDGWTRHAVWQWNEAELANAVQSISS